MSTPVRIQLFPALEAVGCGSSCGTSCGPQRRTSAAESQAVLDRLRGEFGEAVVTETASYRTVRDVERVVEDLGTAFAADGSLQLHLLRTRLADVLAAGPFLAVAGRIVARGEFPPYASIRAAVAGALDAVA